MTSSILLPVSACQTGDGVEEDDDVVSALDHALSFLEHDACNLDVTVGGLVEGRGDDLGIDGAGHVGDLLGALVDEQHHDVCLGVVGGYGVGNVLHEDGLTGLGLCHDECALALSDGREEVDDAHRGIGGGRVAAEGELLFGEKWGEVLEGYAVAHFLRVASVDVLDVAERKVLLVVVWRTHGALHHVAGLQPVALDLLGVDIDIVGRGEIVVVR